MSILLFANRKSGLLAKMGVIFWNQHFMNIKIIKYHLKYHLVKILALANFMTLQIEHIFGISTTRSINNI